MYKKPVASGIRDTPLYSDPLSENTGSAPGMLAINYFDYYLVILGPRAPTPRSAALKHVATQLTIVLSIVIYVTSGKYLLGLDGCYK